MASAILVSLAEMPVTYVIMASAILVSTMKVVACHDERVGSHDEGSSVPR